MNLIFFLVNLVPSLCPLWLIFYHKVPIAACRNQTGIKKAFPSKNAKVCLTTTFIQGENAVNHFIQKYESKVKGTLSGWDRIVFRGYIRTLAYVLGMTTYLQRIGCLLKDFGEHAQTMTEQLLLRSLQRAERFDRPIQYIASSSLRKEDYARNIAQADGITDGLVAVLTCVEPCRSTRRNGRRTSCSIRARNCRRFIRNWFKERLRDSTVVK